MAKIKDTLKCCPFCGKPAGNFGANNESTGCVNDDCNLCYHPFSIAEWNTRTGEVGNVLKEIT